MSYGLKILGSTSEIEVSITDRLTRIFPELSFSISFYGGRYRDIYITGITPSTFFAFSTTDIYTPIMYEGYVRVFRTISEDELVTGQIYIFGY
jgi:hypothetical protein